MSDFLYQKIRTGSVNHIDSGNIKILVQFAGNSALKICGTQMRALSPSATTLISKDGEFSCASFDLYEKFAG